MVLRLLAFLLILTASCKARTASFVKDDDQGNAAAGPGDGRTAGPVASAACDSLCQGVDENAEGAADDVKRAWAACFSCRCKESLGWLPSAESLQCSNGTLLSRYKAHIEPAAAAGQPRLVGVDTIDPECTGDDCKVGCLNGGIASAGCDLKSTFQRIKHDQVEFQIMCRKRWTTDANYYEYLIIGANAGNGATCFWQGRDPYDDTKTAALDVTDADHQPIAGAVNDYVNTYYLYSAGPSSCTGCHGESSFIWSPYFSSAFPVPTNDRLTNTRLNAPYFKVAANSDQLQPVGHTYLTAGPTTAGGQASSLSCTSCHRVADGTFCNSFSFQALGLKSNEGNADPNSFDHGSAFAAAARQLFWMPPNRSSYQNFLTKSADDAKRIQNCCGDRPDPACEWNPSF